MKKTITRFILEYFRSFAKLQLQKNPQATVIGITGSAGKTSTRLAIVHILKTRGVVKQSVHANSETGIPLNILGIAPQSYSPLDWLRLIIMAPLMYLFNWERYNYYVVEMGIDSPDEPKNMSYLLKIIRPHIGVVLNAGLTHAAAFDHLVKDHDPKRRDEKLRLAIAREKMMLVKGLDPQGIAIINSDQKELIKYKRDIAARQITFGFGLSATLRILEVTVSKAGFIMRCTYQGQEHVLQLHDVFAEHYAYTFAASIAVCAALGIAPSVSIAALTSYRAPAGRLRIFPGKNDATIIDSSYNASPTSMQQSLQLLKKLGGRAKKIAVIGDMRELGTSAKIAHKKLADWLTMYCDEVLLFGELTKAYILPILTSHKFPVHHFESIKSLNTYLRTTVRPKSWVLVKGSQNTILLERAVASILANKEDEKFLCRRGPYWDKIRAKTP